VFLALGWGGGVALAGGDGGGAAREGLAKWSGIYPHLAFFNDEGECGTGAVVPWAGRLWAITYGPHLPRGSSDKLYEISEGLEMVVRPESVGGTHANRMVHRESGQLFMGNYVIDGEGVVRVIPVDVMVGRQTGNARHLTDPVGTIYYGTMEEGFYEVDVESLEVTELYVDGNKAGGKGAELPGVHGKGLYSGQGRMVYSNNGEGGQQALRDPRIEAGVLAEWDGAEWAVVERAQFTEVTGPGGIYGNEDPEGDPIWAVGWDVRSVILLVLDEGEWHRFRLPKASHSYDGAHGWNTEWPRIREIGEGDDLLMTMHGMFWRFPLGFRAGSSAGIRPRSSYLKVVGDFCRWGERVVLGCDDAANREFLNKRRAKGEVAGPRSQSNLWFLAPEQIDQLGPVIARGGVWVDDTVAKGQASDPYLFAGMMGRTLTLAHGGEGVEVVAVEIDRGGTGEWEQVKEVEVAAGGIAWVEFDDGEEGEWVRLVAGGAVGGVTAWFTGRGADGRGAGEVAGKFDGLARRGADGVGGIDGVVGGLVRARGGKEKSLHFAAWDAGGDVGYYVLGEDMVLRREDNAKDHAWLKEHAAIPGREGVLEVDAASVIYTDDEGVRWRLPRGGMADFDEAGPMGWGRIAREVVTERDIFLSHGTFYELPADNAGGIAMVRPVATHDRDVIDFCSYRGLMVLSGVDLEGAGDNWHVIRSDDGRAGLWVGAIDDLWELGKPVGVGGPWLGTKVVAGEWSEPYLMTGYDRKAVRLEAEDATAITMEVDVTGAGHWVEWRRFELAGGGEGIEYEFPAAFQGYWVRFMSGVGTVATAQLRYE